MNKSGRNALLFFGIFWSALTLLFDGFLVVTITRQLLAIMYPWTEGTIAASEVTFGDDDEGGTTHGVAVSYAYSVGGQDFTGTRYRYENAKSTDSAWAYAFVRAAPPGTRVKVFYNPHHPQDAILAPGLQGNDLFMLLFLTPFNAVMLFLWWSGWRQFQAARVKRVAGGVKLISEAGKTRARLTAFTPLGLGFGTMALLAFLSGFVVCFFFGGFHPRLATMLATWSVVLIGTAAAGLCCQFRILSGKYDLVLDEAGRSLDLPLTQGRKTARRVPFEQIQNVRVETVQKQRRGDDDSRPQYAPTLELSGTEPVSERLVVWYDAEKARQFTDWLRAKLPQKPPAVRPLAGRFSQ